MKADAATFTLRLLNFERGWRSVCFLKCERNVEPSSLLFSYVSVHEFWMVRVLHWRQALSVGGFRCLFQNKRADQEGFKFGIIQQGGSEICDIGPEIKTEHVSGAVTGNIPSFI